MAGVTDQASGNLLPIEPPGRPARSDDPATVIAAGMLSATLAAFCHETLGHGLGCVVDRGHIILLTSIWFQCRGAGSVTDAGGPIGSLIFGIATVALLSFRIPDRVARLVLVLFGGISLFWFAVQLITHPIGNRDDWAFVARRMGWPWMWRPIMATIGIVAYAASMRAMSIVLGRNDAPSWQAIRLAYAAGAASAVIAGFDVERRADQKRQGGVPYARHCAARLAVRCRAGPPQCGGTRRRCCNPRRHGLAFLDLDCRKRGCVRQFPLGPGAWPGFPRQYRLAALNPDTTGRQVPSR
jgi:hypothetical protein